MSERGFGIEKPGMVIEGSKYDKGKARYDLIAPLALEALVGVYTYGAQKYADHNWRKGIRWSRVFGAVMRHLWAFWRGENKDPESGLLHLSHAMWGCAALIDYYYTKQHLDDRYKEPVANNADEEKRISPNNTDCAGNSRVELTNDNRKE